MAKQRKTRQGKDARGVRWHMAKQRKTRQGKTNDARQSMRQLGSMGGWVSGGGIRGDPTATIFYGLYEKDTFLGPSLMIARSAAASSVQFKLPRFCWKISSTAAS